MSSPRRSGILNIDKPPGITSRRAVDHVADFVRPDKTGHAGTLDPLATGVLVICVGRATRLIELIQQQPKSYQARFLLGRTSDTDDVTGQVTDVADAPQATAAEIAAVLPRFTGRIMQAPPAFSAVHVEGARAYQRARRGEKVEPAPRPVDVFRLELTRFVPGEMEIDIDCGSGTYVRSIGRDIGRLLGCGAVMAALTRTRIGPFLLADAVPLERLTPENFDEHLRPTAIAVQSLPKWTADADDAARICTGKPFGEGTAIDAPDRASIAVLNADGELLCLAEYDAASARLLPRRVFIT